MNLSRSTLLFIIIALVGSFLLTIGLIEQPFFTDAFYHKNVANRLAKGEGLVDDYLWTYIGSPEALPAPSHLYWMPLTSIVSGLSMSLLNAPDNHAVAQLPLWWMFFGTILIAFWLGKKLGGSSRHAWVAGLLVLFSGFYGRWWGATDTFAPYAFIGVSCLVFMGLGLSADIARRWLIWVGVGVLTGLAHLTRADGLLLLFVAWAVLLFPTDFIKHKANLQQRLKWIGLVTIAYLLTMTPWFLRNLEVIGTPLPIGGTQSIWFTEYNDLFNYPPDSNPQAFFANGLDTFFASRWEAVSNNVSRFIAEQGWVILTPFMLIGLWVRRQDSFLRGFLIYALGLHLATTLVFPYPGYRGGLFHSASALLPFWAVLGVIGLDVVIDWVSARRRTWNPKTAKPLFSTMLVLIASFLTLSLALPNRIPTHTPSIYVELQSIVPDDARIMINDPAQLYYFTGLGGVVLPNEPVAIVPTIAREYEIDYLLIEGVQADGLITAVPLDFSFDIDNPPEFLSPIPLNRKGMRLYAIIHD